MIVYGVSCYSLDIKDFDNSTIEEKKNSYIIKSDTFGYKKRMVFYISEFELIKQGKQNNEAGVFLKPLDIKSVEKYTKSGKLRKNFVLEKDIKTCIFHDRIKCETLFNRYIELSQRVKESRRFIL